MHVGVFLDDKKAFEGGGFTFIHDIVAAFLAGAATSTHSFTLFCPQDYVDAIAGTLPPNVKTSVAVSRSFVARLISELRHTLPMFAIVWRRLCPLERVARSLGVEVMWFVGGAYDTLEMPYFTTVWDLQHRTHPWFPEVSAGGVWEHREAFFTRHLRRAARIITGTHLGRREIEHFYGVPDTTIIILPHPTPRFALEAASLPLPPPPRGLEPGFLFYPAQFWAHKNHINLLRGYRLLCDRDPAPPPLVFSGSEKGNHAFVQNAVRDLGLTDHVHFLGFVTVDEIVALYRNARALVYASFSGPENLPPLEALALGCPVIASDFPGAREQLGDCALFFDPHDPRAICDTLSGLLHGVEGLINITEKGRLRAIRWTSADFVRGVFDALDRFETERRAWPC
jgi:glycosyltransferase involved in cell wall biosynthesis